MTSSHLNSFGPWRPAFIFLLICSLSSAHAEGLRTVQRKMNSYGRGEITLTCLVIDGGIVPLAPPNDAKMDLDEGIKVVWPNDSSAAVFRAASPEEIALLDAMGKPDAPAAWQKYLAATIHAAPGECTLRDFQPDILAVNHWHMGAISVDCSFDGVKSSRLLLLWRCQDGSTIAVTMRASFDEFTARRDELYAMIGSAMLIPK